MRRTGRTPIDDDAEKAETRPLEASMPLSIKGIDIMNKSFLQNYLKVKSCINLESDCFALSVFMDCP